MKSSSPYGGSNIFRGKMNGSISTSVDSNLFENIRHEHGLHSKSALSTWFNGYN
jgi:hypothetical protein